MYSYVFADSFSAFQSFYQTVIRGLLITPLFIYAYKHKNEPNRVIRFFCTYLSIVYYDKGPHVLFCSLYILSCTMNRQRELLFLFLCGFSFVLSCYQDLVSNGSDIFAVFFYGNCATYLLYTYLYVNWMNDSFVELKIHSSIYVH